MPENYHIRLATEADDDFIWSLRKRNFLINAPMLRTAGLPRDEIHEAMTGWTRRSMDDMLKKDDDSSRFFVAVSEDDKPVGYIIVLWGTMDDFTQIPQGFIFDLGVSREHWGTGVAQLLMDEAEKFVKEKGGLFVSLNVNAHNGRAVAFYKKLGYMEEWKIMGKRLFEIE